MAKDILKIDVGKAVDYYNKNNPELKRLTQKDLGELVGCKGQVFSDYKRNPAPEVVHRLFQIEEITGLDLKNWIGYEKS